MSVDLIRLLLKECRNSAFLSEEEETRLIQQAQEGSKEALDILTKTNLPWIVSIVRRSLSPRDDRFLEAVNEGYVGFHHSVMRFDKAKANRLKTYSDFWVRRFIRNFLMKGSLVRVPFGAFRKFLDGTSNGDTEAIKRALSMEYLHEADELERIPVGEKDNRHEWVHENLKRLRRSLRKLPERQQIIIRCRLQGMIYEDIGQRLGISKQRVRQIYGKIMESLREMLV